MIDWPEVEPQVTSRPPRLRHKQRAVERVGADMLEGDVDALLAGELAHDAFEALGAVIDDVIGAERLGLLRLGVVADGGDDGAADRLRHFDRGRADAGAAGLHQNGLARFELGIVEQHVLHGAEGDRRAGGVAEAHARRDRHHEPRRHVDQVAGKAVDMEAHDARRRFRRDCRGPRGRPCRCRRSARHRRRRGRRLCTPVTSGPDGGDFAGRLDADDRAAACAWRTPCRASPRRRCG